MGSQGVGRNWVTFTFAFTTYTIGQLPQDLSKKLVISKELDSFNRRGSSSWTLFLFEEVQWISLYISFLLNHVVRPTKLKMLPWRGLRDHDIWEAKWPCYSRSILDVISCIPAWFSSISLLFISHYKPCFGWIYKSRRIHSSVSLVKWINW